jgi:CheY-like chemotaxis protein
MPQSNLPILIVEDSPEDYEAIVRALGKLGVPNPIYRFSYGEDAFDFLKHRGPFFKHGAETRPGLLILDLNLPERSGHEVLKQIRQDPALELIPVVVLSSSTNVREAERCYQNGANAYIVKPSGATEFTEVIRRIKEFWLDTTTLPTRPDTPEVVVPAPKAPLPSAG